jgi:hypothetical protein
LFPPSQVSWIFFYIFLSHLFIVYFLTFVSNISQDFIPNHIVGLPTRLHTCYYWNKFLFVMIAIRSTSGIMLSGNNARSRVLIPTARHLAAVTTTPIMDPPHNNHVGATRYKTSPAYRRHLKKQMGGGEFVLKGHPRGPAIPASIITLKGGPGIPAHKPGIQEPTLEVSAAMPNSWSEMDNEILLTIAEMGNYSARVEVLKRHIMSVDQCDYKTASKTFEKIAAKSREGMLRQTLPYQIGIACALTAAVGSIPMVFDVNTAMWFNHHYVTAEIPESNELETWLGR